MPDTSVGKWLIIVGLILVLLGVAILLGGRIGLGRLPGDIRYKSDHVSFYFPLVTSILLSIMLSLVLWIIGKLWR